jgi:hypothetical protein
MTTAPPENNPHHDRLGGAPIQYPVIATATARRAGAADEDRLPFQIPLQEKPNRIRLVCGKCCNDGIDEIERLAALAGQLA